MGEPLRQHTKFPVGQHKSGRLALAALIAGALCIGLSPVLVRLSEVEPVATAFYRVFLGLPLMLIWMAGSNSFISEQTESRLKFRDVLLLLLPGLFFAGDLGFWHWSIRLTTVANATLFANFAPVYVTLVAVLFFGERFSRSFILALVLAMSGAVILMGSSTQLSPDHIKGDMLGMLAAIFYAGYLLMVGRLRSRFTTVAIMFWSSMAASMVLFPASWFAGEIAMPQTLYGWTVLFVLAWVSHLGGQGLIAYALAHLSTAFSSVSLLIQPVFSAILAWVLFGEYLGPVQISGGLVVLVGIYLARRASYNAGSRALPENSPPLREKMPENP